MSGTRLLAGLLMAAACAAASSSAEAGGRQYYTGWTYYPQRSYYYSTYYYKPVVTYTDYSYHYCVYTPSSPRYIYYYNPSTQVYWGRFDLQGKEGEQYSLLKNEDRKKSLTDIPESAFPKPAAMPAIPEAEDGAAIDAPPAPPKTE